MINKIKIPHIPFYFVRHGQTDWNKEHKVMGQTDIPLNDVGLKQAQVVAKNIAHLEISHIVSSPLKRALQTSEIIAATMNRPIAIIDELKECSAGIMEGQHKGDGEWIEYHRMDGDIESAEHWSHFVLRITVGLNSALATNPDEKPILIVSHGHVYRALLRILNAQAIDMNAKNCGVYFFSPPDLDSNLWIVNALGEKD